MTDKGRRLGILALLLAAAATAVLVVLVRAIDAPRRALRAGDQRAICEYARQGPSVVPEMLAGMDDADPTYRDACRQVLYLLWNRLTSDQRKRAATGQLSVRLVSLRQTRDEPDGGRLSVVLQFDARIPGSMKLDGSHVHLLVDGQYCTSFKADVGNLPTTPGVRTTLAVPTQWLAFPVKPQSRVRVTGRSFFAYETSSTTSDGTPIVRIDDFVPGEFHLDWDTDEMAWFPDRDAVSVSTPVPVGARQ